MSFFKAIIADDNLHNTSILKRILDENFPNIRVFGETATMVEAIKGINKIQPDLIFINIVLGNKEIFKVLDNLTFQRPHFVFILESEIFPDNSWLSNAFDYILQPFVVADAIGVITESIRKMEHELAIVTSPSAEISVKPAENISEYVAISSLDKIDIIHMKDITYCAADGKYTNFHLDNGKSCLSSRNMGEYIDILDSSKFFRIHNSYIVNMQHVIKITKKDGYYCEFANGVSLPVAKRRQEAFNIFIKLKS